jgi:putative ABC transport system permease protein
MKFKNSLKIALNIVVQSKLRSWLTIVGIVIGVGSVIAIMSLGKGMEAQLEERLSDFGADLLTLTAGYSAGSSTFGHMRPGGFGGGAVATEEEIVIDTSDVQVLRGVKNIKYISPQISGRVEVYYLGKSGSVNLKGVDQKTYPYITEDEIAEGRMLDSSDRNVILIGGRLAEDYFGKPLGINKMLTIEGSAYRVVGILDDSSTDIIIPIQAAYSILDDSTQGQYDSVTIQIEDENLLDETIEAIEKKLMLSRHVTEKTRDFSISSGKEIQEQISETMGSMTDFLLAIAAVSLFVGTIGVANTMFTSVLEKTKEIGIMKAIGSKNKDIMQIFVLTSGIMGIVGGVLGIFVGTILSSVFTSMISGGGPMRAAAGYITPDIVFTAVGISFASGLIAGIIPAYQASKLKPVDALRYE